MQQSPSKRPKSIYKNQSPRASPRGFMGSYSPANSNKSNKSNKSNRNSVGSSSSKNNSKQSPSRVKHAKPTFENLRKDIGKKVPIQTNKNISRTNITDYDVISPQTIKQDLSTTDINSCNNKYDDHSVSNQNKSVFFLPESMAFILSNSIECNNGITNINNNINIYNSPDIDLQRLKTDAKNASLMGKINTKTGEL